MRVDLHMHSTFSDGLHSPTRLVEIAVKQELAAISLTDHDSLDGIGEALDAGRKNALEVVPGTELSSEFHGKDLHILGYGIDPEHGEFQDMLSRFRDTRHSRAFKIVEKLNALGMSIDPAEVLAKAGGGAVGRPHVAAVLVDKGIVSSTGEAFARYIAEGGPAYVKKYKLTPREAVDWIHAAGGLAFVAHPGLSLENIDELDELVAEGFDGIEVFYPKHDKGRTKTLGQYAEERGLLVSGGSDYHGFNDRETMIGSLDIPYEVWEKIKERLGQGS